MSSQPENPNQDFAQEFYWRMREIVSGRLTRDAKRRAANTERAQSRPFEPGRDAVRAGETIDQLFTSFGLAAQLGEALVISNWVQIVGQKNAENSQPEGISRGTLTVRCKSTAWATQLKLMQAEILKRLQSEYPKAEITAIRFIGPDAPTWKKGQRSVPGRGPRDTYG